MGSIPVLRAKNSNRLTNTGLYKHGQALKTGIYEMAASEVLGESAETRRGLLSAPSHTGG